MAGKGNYNASNFLKLLFQAVTWASVGTNAAGPYTNLYVSLHTADPGAAGAQNTSETTYTGYSRVAVVRTSGGWSISGETISNVAAVTFGQDSDPGSVVLLYFGIGTDSSGAGNLLYSGALTSSLTVSQNITPSFAIGALTVTEA